MGRTLKRHLCAAVLSAGAAFAPALHSGAVQASDRARLMPFAGETAAEFEARRHGRPRPSSGTVITGDGSGHFVTTALINGEDVKAVIDTGASAVVLPYEEAERIGYRLKPADFTVPVDTANGRTTAAPIRLKEVQVGEVTVRDVGALVGQPGAVGMSLLGMSFLGRLKGFQTQGALMSLQP